MLTSFTSIPRAAEAADMGFSNEPQVQKLCRCFRACLVTMLGSAVASVAVGGEACPDIRALELFGRATLPAASRDELARVIQEATRPEDEPARLRACRRLDHALDAYEQVLAQRREDLRVLPSDKTEDELEEVAQQRAVLEACPRYALFREQPLPLMRSAPKLSAEVVRKGITGWVRVEATLDERGAVTAAEVAQSSHALLEAAAIDAVSRFVYYPPGDSGPSAPVATAMIVTDYFAISDARGCDVGQTKLHVAGELAEEYFDLWFGSLPQPTRDAVLEVRQRIQKSEKSDPR